MAKKKLPYDQKYYDPEIECMPRPELEQLQLERLKEMVRWSYDNAPYYKQAWDEAGVSPEDIHTLKDIEKFPFIDKKTERETQGVGSFFGGLCAVPEELAVAMNGYTFTSGILVGITDGGSLTTIPLESDVELSLGYVARKEEALSPIAQRFVEKLARSLELYAK